MSFLESIVIASHEGAGALSDLQGHLRGLLKVGLMMSSTRPKANLIIREQGTVTKIPALVLDPSNGTFSPTVRPLLDRFRARMLFVGNDGGSCGKIADVPFTSGSFWRVYSLVFEAGDEPARAELDKRGDVIDALTERVVLALRNTLIASRFIIGFVHNPRYADAAHFEVVLAMHESDDQWVELVCDVMRFSWIHPSALHFSHLSDKARKVPIYIA